MLQNRDRVIECKKNIEEPRKIRKFKLKPIGHNNNQILPSRHMRLHEVRLFDEDEVKNAIRAEKELVARNSKRLYGYY